MPTKLNGRVTYYWPPADCCFPDDRLPVGRYTILCVKLRAITARGLALIQQPKERAVKHEGCGTPSMTPVQFANLPLGCDSSSPLG